jgi:hypothetical protein
MRKHALILENLDGFDDLKNRIVMRAIPHTLAMRISLTPAAFDGSTVPPIERTGWSGDGAPGNGSLRAFAIGAVTQHFTRTLNRETGVDFVLPTDAQLNAREAFQLSLRKNQELSLPLSFKAHLDDIIAGQQIFLNDGTNTAVGAGKCNNCHQNAGANTGGSNFNFNTGVEAFLRNRIDPDPLRPIDGGFAAFLRVLNGPENIRSVIAASRKAIQQRQQAKSLLGVAIADSQDAINVLRRRDAKLKPIDALAIVHLVAAKDLLQKAKGTPLILPRDALIRLAIQFLEAARGRLVD